MNKMHVRKGDTVMVISGTEKGKKGKVLAVSPKEGKVIVEGIKLVTKHMKPKQMGQPGGLVKAEGAFYACKVMPICGSCGKPTRVAKKIFGDNTKERICAKCKETL